MDGLFTKLLESLFVSGPVALILATAVWWQTKGNQALVTQLDKERKERMDAMDAEIERQRVEAKEQRERSDACERDRLLLHMKIADLVRCSAKPNADKPEPLSA